MKRVFFNKSLKFFKERKIRDKKIILGLSGGLDSAVLLDLLKELSGPCKLELCAAHIHHGPSPQKNIQRYRGQAKKLSLKLSSAYGLKLIAPPPPKKPLKSEEEFRNLRRSRLKKILEGEKADIIALAHNKNDLLETRLIQLVRGCGEKGLGAMAVWQAPYLRPLLFWTREEIEGYAKKRKLKWLDDPSNKDSHYFRNWIRNKWLADLEKKRSGSIKSLSRSLEVLAGSQNKHPAPLALASQGINRQLLMELSFKEQKQVLAFYMRRLKLSNYGQSHIEEILKQAERKEKSFSIKILKKTWSFTPRFISAK